MVAGVAVGCVLLFVFVCAGCFYSTSAAKGKDPSQVYAEWAASRSQPAPSTANAGKAASLASTVDQGVALGALGSTVDNDGAPASRGSDFDHTAIYSSFASAAAPKRAQDRSPSFVPYVAPAVAASSRRASHAPQQTWGGGALPPAAASASSAARRASAAPSARGGL